MCEWWSLMALGADVRLYQSELSLKEVPIDGLANIVLSLLSRGAALLADHSIKDG